MTQPWQPANDTERALMDALARDDRREFFRVIASADLYLPQRAADAESGQEFVTVQMLDHTFLPVFTSVEGMAEVMSRLADAYTVTNYQELREKWPVPEWRLAVNPGFPIDAYSSIESVAAAAAGEEPVPTAAELIVDGISEDPRRPVALDPHELLTEATARADVDGYVDALLDTDVMVPTTREVTDPEDLTGPEAPWYRAGPPERPVIEVFTSTEAYERAHPDLPHVIVPFVALLMIWPEGHGLAVNPGDATSLDVPSEEVHTLLLWADASLPTPPPGSAPEPRT